MKQEELEKIEAELEQIGFKRGTGRLINNADHYMWKNYGKDSNPYEEERPLYQVFVNVYDWRKYFDIDSSLRKANQDVGLAFTVSVSRTIDECPIRLDWDLKDEEFSIEEMEKKAFNFFKFVEENFALPIENNN